VRVRRNPLRRLAAALIVAAGLAACGSGGAHTSAPGTALPNAHPQVVEPDAGVAGAAPSGPEPVGDPHAHAPPLSEVRRELRLELVAVKANNAFYVNPLQYVSSWGRTDQGVDATMPVGAPILAPGTVKILAVIPGWYAGQPLVYFELLDGVDAGRVQYVAEQITAIVPPGTILTRGQPVARYAKSGTAIEYGWSTLNGVTMAKATTGYEEGQVTPAGLAIRAWLNALGANAGNR
jgi:hypothetical protein